ncbi:MAG: hypothetical protein ACT4QF_19155 [Sporichthyaceae bacterium]|jgi:hypothetical protein
MSSTTARVPLAGSTVRNLALLPWRTTAGVVRLGVRGLRAIPRQVRRSVRPTDSASPDAGLLAASADRSSAANHELHKPGEGKLPIPHYDELTAADAAIAVQALATTTEVQATLRHERAGKNRKTVADAGEKRLSELATV